MEGWGCGWGASTSLVGGRGYSGILDASGPNVAPDVASVGKAFEFCLSHRAGRETEIVKPEKIQLLVHFRPCPHGDAYRCIRKKIVSYRHFAQTDPAF